MVVQRVWFWVFLWSHLWLLFCAGPRRQLLQAVAVLRVVDGSWLTAVDDIQLTVVSGRFLGKARIRLRTAQHLCATDLWTSDYPIGCGTN
jgi:hypothetical protein